MTGPDETVLVIHATIGVWRRRLGPLAWAALEHLALAAQPDHHGWVAPLGVRDIATGIGVTKDTAARAVTTLRAAGLVTLEQLDRLDRRRRSGYRLHLPEGIQLRACPKDQDNPRQPALRERCPTNADNGTCRPDPHSAHAADVAESGAKSPRRGQPRPGRVATTRAAQSTLFDPATITPAQSTR
jgi:DNA-binding transcriptional ArsR family regulator